MAFLRGAIAEPLAGSLVEGAGNGRAVLLGQVTHTLPLGEILPDQAIGILVGAALPTAGRPPATVRACTTIDLETPLRLTDGVYHQDGIEPAPHLDWS